MGGFERQTLRRITLVVSSVLGLRGYAKEISKYYRVVLIRAIARLYKLSLQVVRAVDRSVQWTWT